MSNADARFVLRQSSRDPDRDRKRRKGALQDQLTMLVVSTLSLRLSDFGAALDALPAAGFIPKSVLSSDAFAELLQQE